MKNFLYILIQIKKNNGLFNGYKRFLWYSKYFIWFRKKKLDLHKDKKIHFLLVGKLSPEENEAEVYKKVLLQYFGSKSEIVPFDNMKKIKSILSSNSIINDNIIFPNEVYK